jgi:hypothetical protein
MSDHPFSRARCCLRCFFWVSVLDIAVAGFARGACYNTPNAAVDSLNSDNALSPSPDGEGYRVTNIRLDLLLGQRWAMISACGHSEWPVLALRIGRSETTSISGRAMTSIIGSYSIPVVRAGDIVRLWRQEDLLRIEATGVSEESGELGKKIRVRLLNGSVDSRSSQEYFYGIVRGPSNVEMRP